MRCSICFDDLYEEKSPMATPCGHMYCIDCATYNFVEAGSLCAICRRPQNLESLIRLFPDYGDDAKPQPSSSKHSDAAGAGREVIAACYGVFKDGQYGADALAPIFSRAEHFVGQLPSQRGEESELSNALRIITALLTEIRSRLEATDRLQQLKEERNSFKHAYKKQKEKVKELTRLQENAYKRAEEELAQQQFAWAQRASSMQEKLESVIRELTAKRAETEKQQYAIMELSQELQKWRSDAVRYKKKYHVLKANTNTLTKAVGDGYADDSLMVI